MGREESFDAFYHATRRGLVHQAFALTGDLHAAQGAVRDAYVTGWHHWRKVGSDAPLDWVRPRAWQLAQRRRTARRWHRAKGMSPQDKATLDAIHQLPMAQRKMLLLTQLAALPTAHAAREIGVTVDTAQRDLLSATASFATALAIDSPNVHAQLAALSETASGAALPRASIVRRAGSRRRQSHTAIGAAAATLVTIASGAFVYQPSDVQAIDAHLVKPKPQQVEVPEDALPTAEQLLDQHQIARLGATQEWVATGTDDNTVQNGINTICQKTRFADPDGLSAWVRNFQARGRPRRSAVQTIEISRSEGQAEKAFATTVGWYAGCQVGRLQLLTAYRVDNIGDQADVLTVRVWKRPVTTYSVAVARIGQVVTSTVAETVGAEPPPPGQIAQSLADAVAMLCATSGAEDCARIPTFSPVPPPPSGEARGILAVADLPPVGRINASWVGVQARRARPNPSATVCDRADFGGAGAWKTRTRTFLIPGANLPSRFGLSETYGVFRSPRAAESFLTEVRRRVAGCEEDQLATDVRDPATIRSADTGMEMSTWIVATDVSAKETVLFRLGFVRVGNKVAQLNFAPTRSNDVSGKAFKELVARAGDRLREFD